MSSIFKFLLITKILSKFTIVEHSKFKVFWFAYILLLANGHMGVWTPIINMATQPFLGLSDMQQRGSDKGHGTFA